LLRTPGHLAKSPELRLELELAQKEALMIAFLLIVATILAFAFSDGLFASGGPSNPLCS
jgi:hypothetical protein